jgi:sugar diacid utilization regulator/GAF domain-containing protein
MQLLGGEHVITKAPTRPGASEAFDLAGEAMRRLAAAAARGNTAVLFAEAERYLATAARAGGAAVLLRSGGAWRAWDRLSEDSADDAAAVSIPPEALGWDSVRPMAAGLFVPVRTGAVCALIETACAAPEDYVILNVLACALHLALTTCERQRIASEHLDETQVLQRVATRILKSHDLEEILLLITQETKRLLAADICGIMLRDDEEIIMRRCVGNFSIDTASLRMRQGQGLAGRVFATHEPCRVEDYLESNLISRDFFGLAQTERVHSAMGAPLLSKEEVIGVLEVWRRRQSTYTEQDTSRLVALANLTSIAIENARLYAMQKSMVQELAEANRALGGRYQGIRQLAQLQQDLVGLLLDGRNLAAIATRAAEYFDADVLIVDVELRVLGAHPAATEVPDAMRAGLNSALRQRAAHDSKLSRIEASHVSLHAQPVLIGSDQVGLVAVVGKDELDEAAELAISQVAMAVALFHLEQRAASRARAETLEALLWDLLEGTDPIRRAALDRARELRVDLDGRLRVFLCSLEGIEKLAVAEGWGVGEVDARRRLVRGMCEQPQSATGQPRLVGTRGNCVAMLLPDDGSDGCERCAQRLALQIAKEIAGLSVHVGVSGVRSDALTLVVAYREAQIAVEVARQRSKAGSAAFDRAGVVGMLLSLRQEADMQRLVQSTFGALLQKDEPQRRMLMKTLRVFFDTNCSQQSTAKRLRVHYKTVSYRLARIAELTGLDLTNHEDRLLADLALYINELMGGEHKQPQ